MKAHNKRLGENIRAARRNKNLTIEALSELAGISESFLGSVERGESSVSLETFISLCKALCVSADLLLFNERNEKPARRDHIETITTVLGDADEAELEFFLNFIKLYRGAVMFSSER